MSRHNQREPNEFVTNDNLTSTSSGSWDIKSRGDSNSALPIGSKIGNFEIRSTLGEGAFGVVYEAYDPHLLRSVAIKSPRLASVDAREQYLREARNAAAIDFQGIVPIYHVDIDPDGNPYVVQKLIEGTDLRKLLSDQGMLSMHHAARLVARVARALSAAHVKGVVHRDLKPENILIDKSGTPWIADFGLALSEDDRSGRPRELAGSPAYMAPEQVDGQVAWLDGRTDIWAVGIILYELLCGKRPFNHNPNKSTIKEFFDQIKHRDPCPIQQQLPGIDPALDGIFRRCCAKDPAARYPSANELANDLEHWLDNNEAPPDEPGLISSGFSPGYGPRSESRTAGSFSHKSSRPQQKSPDRNWLVISLISTTTIGIAAICFALFLMNRSSEETAVVIPAEVAESGIVDVPENEDTQNNEDYSSSVDSPTETASEGKIEPDITPPKSEEPNYRPGETIIVAIDGTGQAKTLPEAIAKLTADGKISVEGSQVLRISETISVDIDADLTIVAQGLEKIQIISTAVPAFEINGGSLKLDGFAIEIDGDSIEKKGNTIDLLAGSLELRNCAVSGTTQNAVKTQPGTELLVSNCQFASGSSACISAKEPRKFVVAESTFKQSLSAGINVAGGLSKITACKFNGTNIGIEVIGIRQNSLQTGQLIEIQDCEFFECGTYGLVVTNQSSITVKGSDLTFTGIRETAMYLSNEMTDDTTGELAGESIFKTVKIKSSKYGLLLQNCFASCDLSDISKIKDTAVMIRGGNLVMRRSKISESSTGLIVNSGIADLDEVNFEKCEMGIRFEAGLLELVQGSVNDGQIGICMLADTCNLKVAGTRVSNQQLHGLQVYGGSATLSQTNFEDNGTAIVALGKAGQISELTVSNGAFRNHLDYRLQVIGYATVQLDNCKSDNSAEDLILSENRKAIDSFRHPD